MKNFVAIERNMYYVNVYKKTISNKSIQNVITKTIKTKQNKIDFLSHFKVEFVIYVSNNKTI